MKIKIGIIGASLRAMTIVNNLVATNSNVEFIIIDNAHEIAEAHISDFEDILGLESNILSIKHSDYRELKDTNILIIDAKTRFFPGMSFKDIAIENSEIIYQIAYQVRKNDFNGLAFILTEPNSLMCQVFEQVSGLVSHKIIGIGTLMETMRFNNLLAKKIENFNYDAYAVGDTNQSFLALQDLLLKYTNFSSSLIEIEKVTYDINTKSEDIKMLKKHYNWASAFVISKIIKNIIEEKNTSFVLNVKNKEVDYLKNSYFSLPTKLTLNGVKEINMLNFSNKEIQQINSLNKHNEDLMSMILKHFGNKGI